MIPGAAAPARYRPGVSNPLSEASTWNLVAPGYAELSVEHFERFATDALGLAEVKSSDRVVDVAAGPGSLSLLACDTAASVNALDYSPAMLDEFRRRAAAKGVSNVDVHQGDGQALPFDDDSFDAGFSMFGLMFFPDRAAGFRELARVLRPGGRAVVASWHPMDEIQEFNALFEALAAELPSMKDEGEPPPLSTPEAIRAEMGAAGFQVEVHERTHGLASPTTAEYWTLLRRAFAPIVLLENSMGDAFAPVAERIGHRLHESLGPGPISVSMTAYLALGRL